MPNIRIAQEHRRVTDTGTPIHPVWRGIGCLLILFIPTLSYILAAASVQLAVVQNWPMPYQLMGYPTMPALLWKDTGLVPILIFIQSQQNLYAILSIGLIYVIFLSALSSFGYALVYRYVGPSRYGPLDAPPPNVKIKRYKR